MSETMRVQWDATTESYHVDRSHLSLDDRVDYYLTELDFELGVINLHAIIKLVKQLEEILDDN